jgi:hypothetical protein
LHLCICCSAYFIFADITRTEQNLEERRYKCEVIFHSLRVVHVMFTWMFWWLSQRNKIKGKGRIEAEASGAVESVHSNIVLFVVTVNSQQGW